MTWRVQLGRGGIGVPVRQLDAAQVGAALEQVGREGVPEEVGVNPLGLEACLGRELAQDQASVAPVSGPPGH